MAKGTIADLREQRGFGFIASLDGDRYFFHASQCRDRNFDQLKVGDAVEYDVEISDDGRPQARKVILAGG